MTSQSYFRMEIIPGRTEIDGRVYDYPIALAYMQTDQSWIRPEAQIEWTLRYHQVLFDLLEVERRGLQLTLLSPAGSDREAAFRKAWNRFEQRSQACREATAQGADSMAIMQWELMMDAELDSTAATYILYVDPYPMACEIHVALGPSWSMGRMGKLLGSNNFSATMGLSFLWKRNIVGFDLGIADATMQQPLTLHGELLPSNLITSRFNLHLNYGFRWVSADRLTVEPMACIGYSSIIWEEVDDAARSFSLGAGLRIGYTLLHDEDFGDLRLLLNVMGCYTRAASLHPTPAGLTAYVQLGIASRLHDVNIFAR